MKLKSLFIAALALSTLVFSACIKVKRSVVVFVDEPKTYSPILTTNAFAVAFSDWTKITNTAAKVEFFNFIEKAGADFAEGILATAGDDVKKMIAEDGTAFKSASGTFQECFGLDIADVLWELNVLNDFDLDLDLEGDVDKLLEKGIAIPGFYTVVCAKKPVDLDVIKAKVTEKFCGACQESEMDCASCAFTNLFAVEKCDYNGSTAYKLSVKDADLAAKLRDFSPVLTAIEDGRIVIFASNGALLDELAGYYSGTVEAPECDPVFAKELQLPDDVLARVVIPKLGAKIRSLLGANAEDFCGDDPILTSVVRDTVLLRLDSGLCVDSPEAFARLSVDFTIPDTAGIIATTFYSVWASVRGFLTMGLASQPELAFVDKVLNGVQSGSQGNTFALAFCVKKEYFDGVDFVALGKKGVDLFSLGEESVDSVELDSEDVSDGDDIMEEDVE